MRLKERVIVSRLGHRGDGIVDGDNGPLYVAGALPGEEVEIERIAPDRAALVDVVVPSPQRAVPPCPHYGTCGGCVAQHMGEALYGQWKQDSVRAAFAQHHLSPDIDDLVAVPPASRRRVTLAMARQKGAIVLGFHAAQSSDVVSIAACAVATPSINRALPFLHDLLSPIVPKRGALAVNVLETAQGLDITVTGAKLPRQQVSIVSAAAGAGPVARFSIDGETTSYATPLLGSGNTTRLQPAGGFAQAVAEVEDKIASLAEAALAGCHHLVELFCGSGALTLKLARRASIHAVEGDEQALAALDQSLRRSTGLKPVRLERRDLFRRPLTVQELKAYDAALVDPPRQGTQAQMPALARAKLKRIVYVSCSPATLARDAKILVEGGFRVRQVTPLDQFLWSRHVEAVAVFER